MFSTPALLIVAGLGVLALVCSVFPVSPTSRTAFLLCIASLACFFAPVYVGIIIATGICGLFVVDALISFRKVPVKRSMPNQLARGVPSEFRIATAQASAHISSNLVSRMLDTRFVNPDVQILISLPKKQRMIFVV